MAGDFIHPLVAGVICGPKDERACRALKRRFDAAVKRRRLHLVYLVLRTGQNAVKDIRAIKACMKAMDVTAVNIRMNGRAFLLLNEKGRFRAYPVKDVVKESLELLRNTFAEACPCM
jgi:hypothetical protein